MFAARPAGSVDYQLGASRWPGGDRGGDRCDAVSPAESLGQIDTVINILYVLMLGTIGALMGRESLQALRHDSNRPRAAKRRHHPLVASLPLRWRFYRSGLYISPLAPLLLGLVVGVLTMLMGVGGGFILVPAMLYILGVSANVVVGTSLFQILFVTMAATMMHALTTRRSTSCRRALLFARSPRADRCARAANRPSAASDPRRDRAGGRVPHGFGLGVRRIVYSVIRYERVLLALSHLSSRGAIDPRPEVSQHEMTGPPELHRHRCCFTARSSIPTGAVRRAVRHCGRAKGPHQPILLREKEKLGVWVNAQHGLPLGPRSLLWPVRGRSTRSSMSGPRDLQPVRLPAVVSAGAINPKSR